MRLSKSPLVLAFVAVVLAVGCSSGGSSVPESSQVALPAVPETGGSANEYIKHVVVIIQENRSFENFFAGYPGANAPMTGCASPTPRPADVPEQLVESPTRRHQIACPAGDIHVALHQVTFKNNSDPKHDWESSMIDWDKGRMDGFSEWGVSNGYLKTYEYVDRAEVQPYWTMAQQYVLAAEMFPTEFGGSFTAHLTLVAGTDDIGAASHLASKAEVDFPDGKYDDCDSPPGTKSSYITAVPYRQRHAFQGPFPCFTQFNSMAEVLDNASVSWRIYASKVLDAGMWEPFEAISYVRYGPDWSTDISAPPANVISDAEHGKLASVSWVTPTAPDSDHPTYHSDTGPSWVASVVNAIGESAYWPHTAIIVLWDDWGGFYDNRPPPQLDYRGLGIRVPCLIISPYAKQGYVSHVQYEYGSILRFIEEVYGLPVGSIGPTSEGYTDGRATSLNDAFDFTQSPRQFQKIPSTYPMSHFLAEPPSDLPVDTE